MKAAKVYAEKLGWRVVPLYSVDDDGSCTCKAGAECRSAGKHPRLPAWQKDASSDLDVIAKWTETWPNANLGIATGSGSGFFALDIDPKNGGDVALAALVKQHGPLPHTPEALTPSGGAHYLFELPDFALGNTASKVGKGIDTRGDGGQIAVAPSITGKGQYRWVVAPWSAPVAPAPAWLLERLGRAAGVSEKSVVATDRGFYPPASDEVLAAARGDLEAHGPAVEGEGGDAHTLVAAALLTHDHALSLEEAWSLLVEWNETCQPPWEQSHLRTKLANGAKYGKLEYGCRRTLDAKQTCLKLARDWQTTGEANADTIEPMLVKVRPVYARIPDMTGRVQVQKALASATGMKLSDLGLPKYRVPPPPLRPGEIRVTPQLDKVADAAIRSISRHVFSRNGVLCEVVSNPDRTFISELEVSRIRDLMSASAQYTRTDDKTGLVVQAPPVDIAAILHARRAHPVRVLEAVTTAPVFLADGTILQERGYNEQSRVYLEPDVEVEVLDEPTRADAMAAIDVFRDLLCDFKFHEEADFSSWLAALLSPLVKAATGNAPVPLICVSASSPGAGKTLATDVIARIVMGTNAEVRPYSGNARDASEWGKRLTSFVKMASPVSVFDNVNGPIGDEGLDRLITSSTWSDRLLGASEAPPLPNVTTWLATGNQIEPVGDTVRRVLMVRIDVDVERPQERTGFKRPLLVDYAFEHRSDLLASALTILRAYHCAGRPPQDLAAWGSFTAWSALVRGALVWAGVADPFLTQRRATLEFNDSESEAHDFWIGVLEGCDGAPLNIVAEANKRDATAVLGLRDSITTHSLRKFLNRFVDRPRRGRRIRKESSRYTLVAV